MLGKIRTLFYRLRGAYYKRQITKTCKVYQEPLRVNGPSYVTGKTELGKNVNFNGMKIAGRGRVVIGNNFHSGRNCFIMTQNHNFDTGQAIPYDSTYVVKDVIIEDNVWLGQDIIILPGVVIGEGAVIQAGSVVVKSIPKYGIAGGHPARVFKYRDSEHYEKLKSQGKFH